MGWSSQWAFKQATDSRPKIKQDIPLARSSEISKSRSLADMDRYRAVTDMRLDWRRERVSWDDMVFWRVMGWKDEEDEVEVLEAGWSIVATGILWYSTSRGPATVERTV